MVVIFADSLYHSTLDRAWTHDSVGRLTIADTGTEANAIWNSPNGLYAQGFGLHKWGNRTHREGWGGIYGSGTNDNPTFTNNRQDLTYDASGNLTAGGAVVYNAISQVASMTGGYSASYDGDRLRGKKIEGGVTNYYLRSSVLGGQVMAEINASGVWQRGYVYLGGQMLAIQQSNAVTWVHQEPYSKGQRLTNSSGTVTALLEFDPFGGEIASWAGGTRTSLNSAQQPHKYTSYDRDADGGDDAMHRRYGAYWSRFAQPDPYDGSYDVSDPQSFNRYAYVGNDPVNFVDPSGLTYQVCTAEFGGPMCMGQGYWGGGVAGGNGWGYDPRPGLREIATDEMDLHPIASVINDRRDDLYGFSSLFAGYSLFFGFFPQGPRPSPHPSPKPNPEQTGFDSCARAAYKRYRRSYLRTTGKAALGTVTWVGGMAIGGLAFKGAVHAAKDLTLSPVGRLLTVGLELGDSGAIVAITSLVSGKVALDGIREGFQNSAQTGREIEDCKNQFPNAKHSFSSLNF